MGPSAGTEKNETPSYSGQYSAGFHLPECPLHSPKGDYKIIIIYSMPGTAKYETSTILSVALQNGPGRLNDP